MNCLRTREGRTEFECMDPSAPPQPYYAPQPPYNPQYTWDSRPWLEPEYAEYEYASCAYEADDECEGWGPAPAPRRSLYEGVNCLPPPLVSALTRAHHITTSRACCIVLC